MALSPVGDRLALFVGQRIRILGISDDPREAQQLKQTCALAPGLTWSPGGDKLAFRDEDGQGRVIDLSGHVSFQDAERRILALGPASAIAFIPDSDRLAVLSASSPGRMTLKAIEPNRKVIWEQVLTRNRMSGSHPEGVNLALSPAGHLLACTTGTSTVWVFDIATGRQVRQFDDHSQTVTGLSWVDDEWLLSASMDATLRVWRLDDPVSATVVETIAAAGLVFAGDQRTAVIWSARGELLAWSLAETPAQLWDRNPPSRNVAAYFTRPAVSAVAGLLAVTWKASSSGCGKPPTQAALRRRPGAAAWRPLRPLTGLRRRLDLGRPYRDRTRLNRPAHVGHCPQASNRMFWKWSLSTDIRMSAPLAK